MHVGGGRNPPYLGGTVPSPAQRLDYRSGKQPGAAPRLPQWQTPGRPIATPENWWRQPCHLAGRRNSSRLRPTPKLVEGLPGTAGRGSPAPAEGSWPDRADSRRGRRLRTVAAGSAPLAARVPRETSALCPDPRRYTRNAVPPDPARESLCAPPTCASSDAGTPASDSHPVQRAVVSPGQSLNPREAWWLSQRGVRG